MKKDKFDFLKVASIAAITLFVSLFVFMLVSTSIALADTGVPTTTASAPVDCSINTGAVRLRSRPTKTEGTVITTLKQGVYVERIAEYYGDQQWSLIATLDYYGNPERLGFVMSRYLNGYQSNNTLGYYQETTMTAPKDLYAYLSVGVSAKGMITKNSKVTLIGVIGEFSLVQFGGNLYLVESVELWGYDPSEQPGSYPYEAKVVAKSGNTVNFRSQPTTSDKNNIITQIPLGNTVTVTGQYDTKWSIVAYNGRSGYMMTEFLSKKESGGQQYFDPYITLWDHTLHTYYGDYVLPAGVTCALEDVTWVYVDGD